MQQRIFVGHILGIAWYYVDVTICLIISDKSAGVLSSLDLISDKIFSAPTEIGNQVISRGKGRDGLNI
jgi:hypothetical protein